VFNEKLASDLIVSVNMPRLDTVHISYRYDFGPWMTFTAGDRVPMDAWPLVDRQPGFEIALPPGQLDVVMQFVHKGAVNAPVYLQNTSAFLETRTNSVLPTGIFVGVNLVLALMSLMMAVHFAKTSFLSVTVMSTVVAMVLLFGSGLGGTMLYTGSAEFNDQAKFIINTAWGTLIPWITALALSIRFYSKSWWFATLLVSAGCGVLSWAWSAYDLRELFVALVGMVLVLSLGFTLAMMLWAWYKNYSRNMGVCLGIMLYASGLCLLFVAHLGQIGSDLSSFLAALLSLLASLFILRGLFLQHRLGRQVLARARISPVRDVLTGLLNREGMQAQMYKARAQIHHEQICALFIYLPVQDATIAIDDVGEQGFESGMVQIAATLSSQLSSLDSVGRISRNAFGMCVMMQPDPAEATRLAQKILSKMMQLASQSTPLCATASLAMAWLPLNSFRIDSLEQHCLQALASLEPGKRIAWVGGAMSYKDAAIMQRGKSMDQSDADTKPLADDAVSTVASEHSSLYQRIHRIEREMLGVDSDFLQQEADRMSRALNDAHHIQGGTQTICSKEGAIPKDFEATEQIPRQLPAF
jgi:GGDEF domain-containing protein